MSAFDEPKYKPVYPIAFHMRHAVPDAWFRIHSLPESKRYPENEEEWDILLQRHRELTERVLVEGSRCRVHYTLFNDRGIPLDLHPQLSWTSPRAQRYSDDDATYTQAAETTWHFDTFREWIRLRSDDDFGWLSFHSLDTDAIYAPYDGGADVFSLDPDFIANIRNEFAKWRSPFPGGL